MRLLGIALAVAISLFPLQLARANNYDELKTAAAQRCAAVDTAAYQSGLLFNPDGYRSFYLRSQCFQQAAVEFRDDQLCAEVKERRSLVSSSWGYSSRQCRKLVVEGIAEDRKVLDAKKRQYQNGALRLRDFQMERNGNGRDYDSSPLLPAPRKTVLSCASKSPRARVLAHPYYCIPRAITWMPGVICASLCARTRSALAWRASHRAGAIPSGRR